MTMTSVAGHLLAKDFTAEFANWRGCRPESLFEAPIVEGTSPESKDIVHNLNLEARNASFLVIWTDCDREGEYIGWEIAQTCLESNRRIQVFRARYSVVSERELKRALDNLLPLDLRQVNAVALRMELDLREGAALTRFLTLFLQEKYVELAKKVISYGSCQFPTLGFVVEQYLRRVRFIPETFHFLQLAVKKCSVSVDSNWTRNRLFDLSCTAVLYRLALQQSKEGAKVVFFTSKPAVKRKPYPLTTVELQKFIANYYKMSSHRVMKIAEDLYNKGLISYPRTETDAFDDSFNFQEILSIQTTHPEWGIHAGRILQNIHRPRKGKRDDKAHPPIHPTGPGLDLSGDEKKIYEFISRRFLACCCEDAKGFEKIVTFQLGLEQFKSKGLSVTERNYLDVYPYDKWQSNQIPDFVPGELVPIESFTIQQGKTTAPNLLTEAQLISTMDKNGIGTDATIHEHIKKIQEREYARKTADHRFEPTPLGLALICGHDDICRDQRSLSKPGLRATMEQHIKMVESGQKTKEESVFFLLNSFVQIFNLIVDERDKLIAAFTQWMTSGNSATNSNRPDERGTSGGSSRSRTRSGEGTTGNRQSDRTVAGSRSKKARMTNADDMNHSSHTSSEFTCHCNLPAVQKTTLKYGAPRHFYKCSLPNGCKYFEWAEESPSVPTHQLENEPNSSSTVKCQCGLRPKRQQSNTAKNMGRHFFSCAKQVNRCKFFAWIDN